VPPPFLGSDSGFGTPIQGRLRANLTFSFRSAAKLEPFLHNFDQD
jgi:hypothetical protein